MRSSIGGTLDYAVLAKLHQPRDRTTLAREARKLAGQGLTEQDIGSALVLDPTAVRKLLNDCPFLR